MGTPIRDVPANVQVFGSPQIARQRPSDITQFLDQNANSVNAGSGQGNRFQQDLDFRGFAASPLLGSPQGLSVFQDGVRINEAFADVVNWDLVPPSAIAGMELIPGSNPVFGLNTLGGALAVTTKSGARYPGVAAEVSGGSFGRQTAMFEYGGSRDHVDWFATGNFVDDGGWAEHNPSRVKQLFGKLGYQDDATDADVSVALADNRLQGTQTLPRSWLDTPKEAYTFPDQNDNRLAFVTAKGSHWVAKTMRVSGIAYYRDYRSTNFSSNVNGAYGEPGVDGAPPDSNEAFNDRSTIDQTSWGAALQLTARGALDGRPNQFTAGASADFGDTTFVQQAQTASFTADRGTVGSGDFEPQTDVAMKNRYLGVYFADTLNLTPHWTLTLSGRWNQARIAIADRSGDDPGIDGTYTFSRFNPAVGINWNPSPALTAYAGYNEGMRAPTAIELTCADAAAPCRLPNLFLADPPLNKVVAKTWETGARGRIGPGSNWSVAVFRSELIDDIQFVAAGQGAINAGFFQNVGKTRRQGVEVAAATRIDNLALMLRYSHLEATFLSPFTAHSPDNSSADDTGSIAVLPGDRIPGIPADTVKLRAEYASGDRWSIGGNVVAASGQYARGDENNQDRNGRLPGYAVINLDAQYNATRDFALFVQIANLFDRAYQNFGLLGANTFTGPDRTFGPAAGDVPRSEQFRAVGAPRGIWLGLRYSFGDPQGRS
jgi:iron complex outermembrane recepter protein